MMRRRARRILAGVLTAAVALAAAVSTSCGGREQPKPAAAKCPKVEGSFFGADKSAINKGDAVRLSWKLPREYVNDSLRIEKTAGGETSSLVLDTAAMREAANPAVLAGAKPPVFLEWGIPDVRPEKMTTYILRASGPEGCQPLELSAKVTVVE